MAIQQLERTAPAPHAVHAAAFLVVDGEGVIARTTSPASAVERATRRLRELIEQDRFGIVKIVDPTGLVVWRESATG
jgi:hypothetical protein